MERKTKTPIKRLSRYFDEVDFNVDISMAEEILYEDADFRVVLYQIDKNHSNYDDIYGESETREIRFLPPVELNVGMLKIEDAENKTYNDNGSLRYQEYGNLSFIVFERELDEKKADINFGDIIGYASNEDTLKYYEVHDDGKINADNESTMYMYKSYYSLIKCTTVDPNQFNGL
jgi:hypothetical protein